MFITSPDHGEMVTRIQHFRPNGPAAEWPLCPVTVHDFDSIHAPHDFWLRTAGPSAPHATFVIRKCRMIDRNEHAAGSQFVEDYLERPIRSDAKVGEFALAKRVEMTVVSGDLARMQKQQIVVVGLQPLNFRPVTRSVVIGQRDEIEPHSTCCFKHTMRRNFRFYAAQHFSMAVAVPGMRMKIACDPRGFVSDHWEGWLFAIELLNCKRIGIRAPLADVWYTENHCPTARLDWTGKVSVARERWTNNDLLRTSSAPTTKSRGPTQAEVDYCASISAGVGQSNLEAPRSRQDIKSSLEQSLVIVMRERARNGQRTRVS